MLREPGTPTDLVDLVSLWNALFLRSVELNAAAAQGSPPAGVRLPGEGNRRIRERLADVESRCPRCAMHREAAFDPYDKRA